MLQFENQNAETMLKDVLASSLLNVSIFEKTPDVSEIAANEGQKELVLFGNESEKGVVLNFEVTENDLGLSSDNEARYVIIKEYSNDEGEHFEFLHEDLGASEISQTIYSEKDNTQKIMVICFRSDSPNRRLLAASRSLEASAQTKLTVSYTKSQWKKDEEENGGGLSLGVIVAIAVVAGVVLVALITIVVCCAKKKKKEKKKSGAPAQIKAQAKTSINESINTTQQLNNPYTGQQK